MAAVRAAFSSSGATRACVAASNVPSGSAAKTCGGIWTQWRLGRRFACCQGLRHRLCPDNWLPGALLLTVKNGLPNSAMPAWPAKGRDDEVWAMVALLQILPDLDAPKHAAFVGVSAGAGSGISGICAMCHGVAGQSDATGTFPRLGLQSCEYLLSSLQACRNGQRQGDFMAGIAGALTDPQVKRLSVLSAGTQTDQAPIRLPSSPADGGTAGRLSACAACNTPAPVARPAFPNLSGHSADCLASQLRLFAQNPYTRGGGPFVDMMRHAGHDLTEADILRAAECYAPASKPTDAH